MMVVAGARALQLLTAQVLLLVPALALLAAHADARRGGMPVRSDQLCIELTPRSGRSVCLDPASAVFSGGSLPPSQGCANWTARTRLEGCVLVRGSAAASRSTAREPLLIPHCARVQVETAREC